MLVHTKEEMSGDGIVWYGYFTNKPTTEELEKAAKAVGAEYGDDASAFQLEMDPVAERAHLQRWWLGFSV